MPIRQPRTDPAEDRAAPCGSVSASSTPRRRARRDVSPTRIRWRLLVLVVTPAGAATLHGCGHNAQGVWTVNAVPTEKHHRAARVGLERVLGDPHRHDHPGAPVPRSRSQPAHPATRGYPRPPRHRPKGRARRSTKPSRHNQDPPWRLAHGATGHAHRDPWVCPPAQRFTAGRICAGRARLGRAVVGRAKDSAGGLCRTPGGPAPGGVDRHGS